MDMNTSTVETTQLNVINMPTGHCAENDVKDNLINVKEMGLRELSDPTADDQNRCPTEDLQNASWAKSRHQLAGPDKTAEVAALLRMTQIGSSGGEGDMVNLIGHHECSKTTPSVFNESCRNKGQSG